MLTDLTVLHPGTNDLEPVVAALASWQRTGGPVQLHPGDLGWQWRFGADAVASSLVVWCRGAEMLAVAFVDHDVAGDEAAVVRLGIAPWADHDDDLARKIISDLDDRSSRLHGSGRTTVEARAGHAVRALLRAGGWVPDESWTPLRRDLSQPVEQSLLRVERVGPSLVDVRVAVQQAAFGGSTFTADRWRTMAAGWPYRDATCLVGYSLEDVAVAAVTVWSAGPGRPGLLEPMGVHRDQRGRGYGTAITLAAAAALRAVGSSEATVAAVTDSSGAVATYERAGFVSGPEVTDFRRGSGHQALGPYNTT